MYLTWIMFSSLKIECLQSAAFCEGSGVEPLLHCPFGFGPQLGPERCTPRTPSSQNVCWGSDSVVNADWHLHLDHRASKCGWMQSEELSSSSPYPVHGIGVDGTMNLQLPTPAASVVNLLSQWLASLEVASISVMCIMGCCQDRMVIAPARRSDLGDETLEPAL